MAEKEELDPIAEMLAVDDEVERGRQLPDPELNTEAPEDKAKPKQGPDGKFLPKEGDDKKADPDPKAEIKPEEKKRTDDTVPLAKYMEEKRALKAELEARDLTIKQINDRLAVFEKANKPEAPKEPDFVDDPKGYVDHKQKLVLEAIAEANKKAEEKGTETQKAAAEATEQVQLQQFFTSLQAHEQRFVAANPDYHEALGHLRMTRAAQLRELAPGISDEEIVSTIRGEERNLAVQLARQGRDPVQTAFNLAKTFGYQPKPKQEVKDETKLPESSIKKLPPDQTLGSGSSANDAPYKEGEVDPVDVALASLFKKRA